jgi:hypothetical protein
MVDADALITDLVVNWMIVVGQVLPAMQETQGATGVMLRLDKQHHPEFAAQINTI